MRSKDVGIYKLWFDLNFVERKVLTLNEELFQTKNDNAVKLLKIREKDVCKYNKIFIFVWFV